eukprot:7344953-Pyramimonas_sp.AAC.1
MGGSGMTKERAPRGGGEGEGAGTGGRGGRGGGGRGGESLRASDSTSRRPSEVHSLRCFQFRALIFRKTVQGTLRRSSPLQYAHARAIPRKRGV